MAGTVKGIIVEIGGDDKRSNGVRPVVCLDEKVQLEKDTNNENTYNIKIQ